MSSIPLKALLPLILLRSLSLQFARPGLLTIPKINQRSSGVRLAPSSCNSGTC